VALVLVVALSSSAPPVACQAASAEDGGPSPPERGTLPVEVPSEKIVVTGRRIDETTARAPTTSVTVIDTSEKSEELQTVTEALAETVGVQVRRFGGLGAFSTISIRGSTSNQVRFYLDGVPLSRARNGRSTSPTFRSTAWRGSRSTAGPSRSASARVESRGW
jgi:outer membrane cobalamin receptor